MYENDRITSWTEETFTQTKRLLKPDFHKTGDLRKALQICCKNLVLQHLAISRNRYTTVLRHSATPFYKPELMPQR